MSKDLSLILNHFKVENTNPSFQPITNGYINNTFLVFINNIPKFILQRINDSVFNNYDTLQHNIDTALLALEDSKYTRVEFIKTKNNNSLAKVNGTVWRLMTYILESHTLNTTTEQKIAFEAGRIIGVFHNLLKSENINNYKDIISDFHYLPLRKEQFTEALYSADNSDKNTAKDAIEFALNTLPKFDNFYNTNIQLRLCHNDTKLNNILFNSDNEALCLIDLDTIMKGYFHYDFGDAIRTIVNPAPEDEKDFSKINFSDSQFKNFVKGLHKSNLKLSKTEIKFLPLATALMPFLHGIRALTDYLNKNKYYKVSYPEQNLDRCKSLFHFSKLAFKKQGFMKQYLTTIYN